MKINLPIGFTKPKREPLFSIEIELDPYSEDVLQEGHQDVTVRFDGSVYTGGKYAGEIPCWDYISQFDKPKSMKRIAFNRFMMVVCGEADQALIAEPVAKRPYSYDAVVTSSAPKMLPHREYLCSLSLQEDHFDVLLGADKIGEIWDKKNRGTIEKINKMLSHGWRTTAELGFSHSKPALVVNIVKV